MAATTLEAKLAEDELSRSLDILKSSSNYEMLLSKISLLSTEQQKQALDYAVKCHKKALAAKSSTAKLTAITLNAGANDGSETKLLTTSSGSTFSVVPLQDSKVKDLPQEISPAAVTILEEKDIIDTEFLEAICNNDIGKLHSLLLKFNKKASDSIAAKNETDAHPMLHWAALEDKVDVLHYLVQEMKEGNEICQIDAVNPRAETALHWACLKGNFRSVHFLLECGASISLPDERGYTALHHAAQFGHTVVIAKLLRGMARKGLKSVDLRDTCGRTPLHWATYKHHPATVTYLIKKGADVWANDWEDCNALHWAALQGDVDVLQAVLWEIKSPERMVKYLETTEKSGKNALQLADAKSERFQAFSTEGKRYKRVCQALKDSHAMTKRGKLPKRGFAGFADSQNAVYDESFFMAPWLAWPIGGLILGCKYFFVIVPSVLVYTPGLVALTSFFFLAQWYVWLALQVKDPGFIVCQGTKDPYKHRRFFDYLIPCFGRPRAYMSDKSTGSTEETLELLEGGEQFNQEYEKHFPPSVVPNDRVKLSNYWRELYYEILDKGVLAPVCTTCEIARPLRSKHDRFSDKCVLRFDHYCPWVGVAVAERNYIEFFVFCALIMVLTILWVSECYYYAVYLDESVSWRVSALRWDMLAWELTMVAPTLFFFLYGLAMVGQHAHLTTINLTTNEMINKFRYNYLTVMPDRKISNIFSRGWVKNWMECLGLEEPVKVNFREHYAETFRGDNVIKRIEEVKKAYKALKDDDTPVSITTATGITAHDINLSKLPTPHK